MKPLTFYQGAGLALALSLAGSVLYVALAPVLPADALLRLTIALLGLAYSVFVIARSGRRTGRVSALLLWVVVAAASWLATPPLIIYLLIHVGLIWLLRSLYFYSSGIPALFDLGLSGFGLAAAVWAIAWSGSLLLAIWCFFLVQSLFVSIPPTMRRGARRQQAIPEEDERFQRACRSAENALRRLSTHH